MKEAYYYEKRSGEHVLCKLCPHACVIYREKSGNCLVRKNHNGILYNENYGRLTALHVDPIEKKPLYHFCPGSNIFSIGSAGCNLHCRFCQNSDISQSSVQQLMPVEYKPDFIVDKAITLPDNIGIAYTYNEPAVFFEFVMDTAKLAKENGLKNIMVTNGFINPDPLEELTGCIDAFNVDLKSFSESFYKNYTGGSLAPVLYTLKFLRQKRIHFEITHLVVTGLNDSAAEFSKMVKWISSELGKDTVLHISRYFPRHLHSSPPTPERTLLEFHQLAKKELSFVYLGNTSLRQGHHTHCPKCREVLIKREGYATDISGLDGKGNCKFCGTQVAVQ
jgi:pyruvate formate lyase activating enzyme